MREKLLIVEPIVVTIITLRYLGPELWGKLATAYRSTKTLKAFTNLMRKSDLTSLMDTGCKGYIICWTSLFIYVWIYENSAKVL